MHPDHFAGLDQIEHAVQALTTRKIRGADEDDGNSVGDSCVRACKIGGWRVVATHGIDGDRQHA